MELAVLAYLGVKLPWLDPQPAPAIPQDQSVGKACAGRLIEPCQTFFGQTQLPIACRTCPGPGAN